MEKVKRVEASAEIFFFFFFLLVLLPLLRKEPASSLLYLDSDSAYS
jgi:hypothetical protein